MEFSLIFSHAPVAKLSVSLSSVEQSKALPLFESSNLAESVRSYDGRFSLIIPLNLATKKLVLDITAVQSFPKDEEQKKKEQLRADLSSTFLLNSESNVPKFNMVSSFRALFSLKSGRPPIKNAIRDLLWSADGPFCSLIGQIFSFLPGSTYGKHQLVKLLSWISRCPKDVFLSVIDHLDPDEIMDTILLESSNKIRGLLISTFLSACDLFPTFAEKLRVASNRVFQRDAIDRAICSKSLFSFLLFWRFLNSTEEGDIIKLLVSDPATKILEKAKEIREKRSGIFPPAVASSLENFQKMHPTPPLLVERNTFGVSSLAKKLLQKGEAVAGIGLRCKGDWTHGFSQLAQLFIDQSKTFGSLLIIKPSLKSENNRSFFESESFNLSLLFGPSEDKLETIDCWLQVPMSSRYANLVLYSFIPPLRADHKLFLQIEWSAQTFFQFHGKNKLNDKLIAINYCSAPLSSQNQLSPSSPSSLSLAAVPPEFLYSTMTLFEPASEDVDTERLLKWILSLSFVVRYSLSALEVVGVNDEYFSRLLNLLPVLTQVKLGLALFHQMSRGVEESQFLLLFFQLVKFWPENGLTSHLNVFDKKYFPSMRSWLFNDPSNPPLDPVWFKEQASVNFLRYLLLHQSPSRKIEIVLQTLSSLWNGDASTLPTHHSHQTKDRTRVKSIEIMLDLILVVSLEMEAFTDGECAKIFAFVPLIMNRSVELLSLSEDISSMVFSHLLPRFKFLLRENLSCLHLQLQLQIARRLDLAALFPILEKQINLPDSLLDFLETFTRCLFEDNDPQTLLISPTIHSSDLSQKRDEAEESIRLENNQDLAIFHQGGSEEEKLILSLISFLTKALKRIELSQFSPLLNILNSCFRRLFRIKQQDLREIRSLCKDWQIPSVSFLIKSPLNIPLSLLQQIFELVNYVELSQTSPFLYFPVTCLFIHFQSIEKKREKKKEKNDKKKKEGKRRKIKKGGDKQMDPLEDTIKSLVKSMLQFCKCFELIFSLAFYSISSNSNWFADLLTDSIIESLGSKEFDSASLSIGTLCDVLKQLPLALEKRPSIQKKMVIIVKLIVEKISEDSEKVSESHRLCFEVTQMIDFLSIEESKESAISQVVKPLFSKWPQQLALPVIQHIFQQNPLSRAQLSLLLDAIDSESAETHENSLATSLLSVLQDPDGLELMTHALSSFPRLSQDDYKEPDKPLNFSKYFSPEALQYATSHVIAIPHFSLYLEDWQSIISPDETKSLILPSTENGKPYLLISFSYLVILKSLHLPAATTSSIRVYGMMDGKMTESKKIQRPDKINLCNWGQFAKCVINFNSPINRLKIVFNEPINTFDVRCLGIFGKVYDCFQQSFDDFSFLKSCLSVDLGQGRSIMDLFSEKQLLKISTTSQSLLELSIQSKSKKQRLCTSQTIAKISIRPHFHGLLQTLFDIPKDKVSCESMETLFLSIEQILGQKNPSCPFEFCSQLVGSFVGSLLKSLSDPRADIVLTIQSIVLRLEQMLPARSLSPHPSLSDQPPLLFTIDLSSSEFDSIVGQTMESLNQHIISLSLQKNDVCLGKTLLAKILEIFVKVERLFCKKQKLRTINLVLRSSILDNLESVKLTSMIVCAGGPEAAALLVQSNFAEKILTKHLLKGNGLSPTAKPEAVSAILEIIDEIWMDFVCLKSFLLRSVVPLFLKSLMQSSFSLFSKDNITRILSILARYFSGSPLLDEIGQEMVEILDENSKDTEKVMAAIISKLNPKVAVQYLPPLYATERGDFLSESGASDVFIISRYQKISRFGGSLQRQCTLYPKIKFSDTFKIFIHTPKQKRDSFFYSFSENDDDVPQSFDLSMAPVFLTLNSSEICLQYKDGFLTSVIPYTTSIPAFKEAFFSFWLCGMEKTAKITRIEINGTVWDRTPSDPDSMTLAMMTDCKSTFSSSETILPELAKVELDLVLKNPPKRILFHPYQLLRLRSCTTKNTDSDSYPCDQNRPLDGIPLWIPRDELTIDRSGHELKERSSLNPLVQLDKVNLNHSSVFLDWFRLSDPKKFLQLFSSVFCFNEGKENLSTLSVATEVLGHAVERYKPGSDISLQQILGFLEVSLKNIEDLIQGHDIFQIIGILHFPWLFFLLPAQSQESRNKQSRAKIFEEISQSFFHFFLFASQKLREKELSSSSSSSSPSSPFHYQEEKDRLKEKIRSFLLLYLQQHNHREITSDHISLELLILLVSLGDTSPKPKALVEHCLDYLTSSTPISTIERFVQLLRLVKTVASFPQALERSKRLQILDFLRTSLLRKEVDPLKRISVPQTYSDSIIKKSKSDMQQVLRMSWEIYDLLDSIPDHTSAVHPKRLWKQSLAYDPIILSHSKFESCLKKTILSSKKSPVPSEILSIIRIFSHMVLSHQKSSCCLRISDTDLGNFKLLVVSPLPLAYSGLFFVCESIILSSVVATVVFLTGIVGNS